MELGTTERTEHTEEKQGKKLNPKTQRKILLRIFFANFALLWFKTKIADSR